MTPEVTPEAIAIDNTEWSKYGYKIESCLGKNTVGARVTYLASKIDTAEKVVIKQFQFATANSSWSAYDACQAEIEALRHLEHPSIPTYLDYLSTDTGFCLIQEYKQAVSLAAPYRWTLEEIKEVAIALLEVLVYLQQQQPSIIHRDLKPDNILVDRSSKIKVYLVDFGFARLGGGEVAASSVVKGTLGFMPPEQMFNRQLTNSSDLYSLGATLICLLTNTNSRNIGSLIDDEHNCFKFRTRLSRLEPAFLDWLDKMVYSNPKHRYVDARTALQALEPISLYNSAAARGLSRKGNKLETTIIYSIVSIVLIAFFARCFQTLSHVKALNQNQSDLRYFKVQALEFGSVKCVGCKLEGLFLMPAQTISRSDLGKADLRNAKLSTVNLADSYFDSANLENAILTDANLSGANFRNAHLKNTNLSNANLQKARIVGANLSGANLAYANLENAHIHNVNFKGANLTGAVLPQDYQKYNNFEGAIMPDGNLYSGFN